MIDSPLRDRAAKLVELIEKAPAGGPFHGSECGPIRVLHEGFANEQYHFRIAQSGEAFVVTIERVR